MENRKLKEFQETEGVQHRIFTFLRSSKVVFLKWSKAKLTTPNRALYPRALSLSRALPASGRPAQSRDRGVRAFRDSLHGIRGLSDTAQ